jgi:hypothetical protein
VREGEDRAIDELLVLAEWRDRTTSEYYPAVLSTLLDTGKTPSDALLEAVRDALTDLRQSNRTNTRFNLARIAARRLARRSGSSSGLSSAALRAAVIFLARHLAVWQHQVAIDAVIDVLKLLAYHEPQRREVHLAMATGWEVKRLERDMTRLAELARRGFSFRLFRYFADLLRAYSMRISPSPEDLATRLAFGPRERRTAVERFRQSGGWPTEPFVPLASGGRALNADFLVLGQYLFDPPLLGERSWDELRARFDQTASRNMLALHRELAALGTIPVKIRDILSKHRDMLQPGRPSRSDQTGDSE